MSVWHLDIGAVRVRHVVRYNATMTPLVDGVSVEVTFDVVHVDPDDTRLQAFRQIARLRREELDGYRILRTFLDILPPIDARAPDGSRLFAHEVRRDGSLVERTDSVQRIWRARKDQWTQDAQDLRAIRSLSSVSFIAR